MTSTLPQKQKVQTLIAAHATQPGALLPLLHAIQDSLGFIPSDSVGDIAKGLNLSRAEVHGVITYYHHFRTEAPAKTIVQICRAEACQSCGSEALYAQAQAAVDGCRPESSIALEAAYCLGLCASSPAIQVNDRLHARVTPAGLEKILNHAGAV